MRFGISTHLVVHLGRPAAGSTCLFELANTGSPAAVLADAQRARERFERTLAHP